MHLHGHASFIGVLFEQPVLHIHHGPLDDIRGSTLHRGVDSGSLRSLLQLFVAGVYLWQVQAAAEERLHETVVMGLFADVVHVFKNAGIAFEITIDVFLGEFALNVQLPGKAKGGHAVDQAEVDGLGAPTLV